VSGAAAAAAARAERDRSESVLFKELTVLLHGALHVDDAGGGGGAAGSAWQPRRFVRGDTPAKLAVTKISGRETESFL
jgi:hypothetical protein